MDSDQIKRRIDSLRERIGRRDTYGTLLAEGEVIARRADVDDPQTWRSELRRQARADRIKIRTHETEEILFAWLPRSVENSSRREQSQRVHNLAVHAVPLACAHRHEPEIALQDGLEVVLSCRRCDALGYGDAGDHLIAGTMFDNDCQNEDPPRQTGLTFAVELPPWPPHGIESPPEQP